MRQMPQVRLNTDYTWLACKILMTDKIFELEYLLDLHRAEIWKCPLRQQRLPGWEILTFTMIEPFLMTDYHLGPKARYNISSHTGCQLPNSPSTWSKVSEEQRLNLRLRVKPSCVRVLTHMNHTINACEQVSSVSERIGGGGATLGKLYSWET